MRYLVTGGAGFIGSHTVERLIREGHHVRVLDNFSSGSEENLSHVSDRDRLTIVEGDIRDRDRVIREAEGVDGIFHLAAIVSVQESINHPEQSFDVNALGSINVLAAARHAGVKRVVLAGSAAVYGDNPDLPLRETAPAKPMSPYGFDKFSTELASAMYCELYGLQAVVLRYFNVYGPRQNASSPYSGVISVFVDRVRNGKPIVIYGDGMQTRDFVHVLDVARANHLAMLGEHGSFRILNIASGIATPVRKLADVTMQAAGRNVGIRHEAPRTMDIRCSLAHTGAASREIGFTAEISLARGLQDMFNGERTGACASQI